MKKAWKSWIKIALKFMNFWAMLFLFLFYALLILPFGIGIKIFFKNVLLGHSNFRKEGSHWNIYKKITPDIKWAREQ